VLTVKYTETLLLDKNFTISSDVVWYK